MSVVDSPKAGLAEQALLLEEAGRGGGGSGTGAVGRLGCRRTLASLMCSRYSLLDSRKTLLVSDMVDVVVGTYLTVMR